MDFLIEQRSAFDFYVVIKNLWSCCCEQRKGEVNLYSKYAEIFKDFSAAGITVQVLDAGIIHDLKNNAMAFWLMVF